MKSFQKSLAATLALCLGLSFTQCNKVDDLPEKEKAITNAQMSNPDNPFDHEGLAHNDFLDFFIVNAELDQPEWNREDWFAILETYHAANGQAFTREYQAYYNEFFNVYQESEAFPCTNFPYNLCYCLPWLCDIFKPDLPKLPFTLPDPKGGTTEYERNLAFIGELKFLESELLKNETIDSGLRDIYLKYYCNARYSAGYWHNVINVEQGQSKWYEHLDLDSGRQCVSCEIVEADAAGAAVGALIAGPPGALAGAAAASAAAALEHLLKMI